MKRALYLLLIFTLISACNSKPAAENTEETSPESPEIMEWLTLKGEADMPNIVFVTGDEEYRSEEALPLMAKIMNKHHGFNCTVLFAQNPEKPGIIDPNYLHNIPGLEQLADADLMVIFTRFRALPDEQMQHIENYLKSGKPVIGIRTATHAFYFKEDGPATSFANYSNSYKGDDEWKDGFGRLVLGEKWISHHGHHRHQSTRGLIAPDAETHPILTGIENGEIWCPTDVYGVRLPLPGDSQPLVLGQVVNRAAEYDENDLMYGMRDTDTEVAGVDTEKEKEKQYDPNNPLMPVAWTKSYQIPGGETGKTFASTIGASTDLLNEATRRMYANAIFWLLDKDVPAKANVAIVGTYEPTPFAFHKDDHWASRNTSISSLAE